MLIDDAEVYQIAVMLYEFMMPDDVDAMPITLAEFQQKLEGVLRDG